MIVTPSSSLQSKICNLQCRQFTEGSGTGLRPQGATAWMVPLGSKYSSLIPLQCGQGILTAATSWALPASPLPAHFRVTPIGDPQVQQAKSRSSVNSTIGR